MLQNLAELAPVNVRVLCQSHHCSACATACLAATASKGSAPRSKRERYHARKRGTGPSPRASPGRASILLRSQMGRSRSNCSAKVACTTALIKRGTPRGACMRWRTRCLSGESGVTVCTMHTPGAPRHSARSLRWIGRWVSQSGTNSRQAMRTSTRHTCEHCLAAPAL